MEATTKYLRLHARELLAATDRGEQVLITYRGRHRALLVPVKSQRPERFGRNPAFGIWRDRDEDVAAQVRALREGRDLP